MIKIDENGIQMYGDMSELFTDMISLVYEYIKTDAFLKLKIILPDNSPIKKILSDLEKLSRIIAGLDSQLDGEMNE